MSDTIGVYIRLEGRPEYHVGDVPVHGLLIDPQDIAGLMYHVADHVQAIVDNRVPAAPEADHDNE